MARHTKQILATKSANKDKSYVRGYTCAGWNKNDHEFVSINQIGEVLCYQNFLFYASDGSSSESWLSICGVGFLVPQDIKNKDIVSVSLNIYSKDDFSNNHVKILNANFIEGSSLFRDWEYSNATEILAETVLKQGWNKITLTKLSENMQIHPKFMFQCSNVKWAELYSHRHSTYKPYLEITYNDIPPNPPTNLSPNNTEVNRKDTIRFSWRHNSNEGYHQKSFTLQYSTNNGSTWTTITRSTANQYYDLPANTFTASSTVLWKVKTVDGNDEESNYSSTATFTAKTPPNPPTNLSPNNTALNPRNVIKFSWTHNSVEGLTQKGFILEYSTDDEGNWIAVNQTTANQYYDLPAKKLPLMGTVRWRVRTIDGNDLVSENSTINSFTLKTPPDNPTSLYPSNITLNPREIIKFSWLHNSNSGQGQKKFKLEYSINGGTSWTTVEQITDNQYYDMPINTLPTSGTVLWKVMTTDSNDEISGYTSASFTLGTPPQQAPIPIQPVGAYLDSTEPILFEWHFMGGTPGETQKKYDLEYSINGGSTWTTITEITSNKSKELPANTFNITGNITWRVRTYNNFDEVSPYSENKTFYVISSPPIPQITSISNNARPIIKWTSQGQHIYELQILQNDNIIIDIGSIPSVSDREYKLKEYLKDGNYKVKLRVINEYNLYSPWAEKSFTISTIKPQKPIIGVYSGEYSVTIKASDLNSRNLIYRDNIYIGELIEETFIDFTGENNKEHQYFIRSIDASDNFNDSDIKLAKCKFSGNTLALVNIPDDFIKLKYGLDSIPKKSNFISNSGNLAYYDGREYPVVEYSKFRSKSKTVSFTLKTKEELNKLIELISSRKTLLFRDTDGENIHGSIFDLEYSKTILGYYEVGFTITKTEV